MKSWRDFKIFHLDFQNGATSVVWYYHWYQTSYQGPQFLLALLFKNWSEYKRSLSFHLLYVLLPYMK